MVVMSKPISETIHIVLGSDEKFAQHLAVTIASILYNARTPIVFHILHDGLSAATIKNIEACADIADQRVAGRSVSFEFILLQLHEFKDLPSRANISLMTYARMKIPTLLAQLPRVLYLDCDMVVCTDLAPLWTTDLGDNPIAACLDFVSPHKVSRLGIAPQHYFNAGMLLMNLDAMRAMGFNDIVVAGFNDISRIFAHDQDFLNLIFKNNWKRVHSRWNVVIHHNELRARRLPMYDFAEFRAALAEPGIIHYTGVKPSAYLHDSAFKDRYWRYLAMTPWRDYQMPRPTLRQVGRKWRKRLKQRALELLAGVR